MTGAVPIHADIPDLNFDYSDTELELKQWKQIEPSKLAASIAARLVEKYSGQEVLDNGQTISWNMEASVRGIGDVSELAEGEHLFLVTGRIDLPAQRLGEWPSHLAPMCT